VAFRTTGNDGAYETGDVVGALTTMTDANAQVVAFSAKDHGGDAMDDCSPTLRAGGHAGSHANAGVMPAVAFPQPSVYKDEQTLQSGGVRQDGDDDASPQETDAGTLLRALRGEVGEEAFAQWGLGILDTLQSPEVLRSKVHGGSVRSSANDRDGVDDDALSCAKDSACGAVQSLWRLGCSGRSPSRWEPSEQLAGQLGAHLSILSQQGASPARFMLSLWQSSEGIGLLREALSAVQKVWRPASDKSQSAHAPWAVRRLTPLEAERLQGFPDGWTDVSYRGKQAADGPRYKALGNSIAVNVMNLIFERIRLVDAR
jgi:hypothetical protein